MDERNESTHEKNTILGVAMLPDGAPLPIDERSVRKSVVATCIALASLFVLIGLPSAFQSPYEPRWGRGLLMAGALMYFVSAFLLSNRRAISRSRALAVLVATFWFSGLLMAADAVVPDAIGAWIWAYWHVGLALGLFAFAAADWISIAQDRRHALRGYYSDNGIRIKHLGLSAAIERISMAVAAAILAALIALDASTMSAGDATIVGSLQAQIAVGSVLIVFLAIGSFPLVAAYRRSLRAGVTIAAILGILIFIWTGSGIPIHALDGAHAPQVFMVRLAGFVCATAASAAVLLLIFGTGHTSALRWWMVASASATALDGLATVLSTLGLAGGWYLSHAYAAVAAALPMGALLYDAKASVYTLQKLATALDGLTLSDKTTGLPNVRALVVHLERQIDVARARGSGFTIAIIDIVGLKAANRMFRRHVGKELIYRTSRVVRAAFSPEVFVGRLRGDEFAVLFPLGSVPASSGIKHQVAEALASADWTDPSRSLALYVDAFVYDPLREQSAEQFLEVCDQQAELSKKTSAPVTAARSLSP